jgi:hypothetical protein
MSIATIETKAEMMDRLRRENRWQDASEFRENCRLKAKREGLNRADARERAWREMAAAYPPLSEDEIDSLPAFLWIVISDEPPAAIRSLKGGDNLSLVELWRASGLAIALKFASSHQSQVGWLAVIGEAMARIHDDTVSDSLKGLLAHAIWNPLAFLKGVALPRFNDLLSNEAAMGDDLEEMRCYCNSLQRLNSDNVVEIFGARG